MATRNHTKRFQELRTSLKRSGGSSFSFGDRPRRNSGGKSPLLEGTASSDGYDAEAPLPSLPPVWVDIVDGIKQDIADAQRRMRKLNQQHKERLKVKFDESEYAAQDRQIEIQTAEITRCFHSSEKKLKRIATQGNPEGGAPLPYQERVVRLNVMRSLAQRVQSQSKDFRQAQKAFLQGLKKMDQSGSEWIPDTEGEDYTSLANLDKGFSQDQIMELERRDKDASEREHAIIEICKNINELHQIFKELSILVVEQGSILDRIDYNVEQALQQVQGGQKELVKAEKYQKRSRTTMCIIFLLFMIGMCGLVLIITKSNKKKKK